MRKKSSTPRTSAAPSFASPTRSSNATTAPRACLFVGVLTRGLPLARRLAAHVADFEGATVPVGALDIGLYRDDLSSHRSPLHKTDLPAGLTEHPPSSLIDDVLYTPGAASAPPWTR